MRFDAPAIALLNDDALWRRQTRAGWLILVPQFVVTLFVGLLTVASLVAMGGPIDMLLATSDVNAFHLMKLVCAVAWSVGAALLTLQLPIASTPQRVLCRLTPVLFGLAAGMEIGFTVGRWSPNTHPLATGIVLVAIAVLVTLLGAGGVRDAHGRRVGLERGVRRLAGPVAAGFAVLVIGGLIPVPRTIPLVAILQLLGAYGIVVMLTGWSLALHQDRFAARLSSLRLLTYGTWILVVLALLFGPVAEESLPIPGLDIIPIELLPSLASILLLSAVAIGVRMFHRSVRGQRFHALTIVPADQVRRDRLARHGQRWTLADSCASYGLATVGVVFLAFILLSMFSTMLYDTGVENMTLYLLATAAVFVAILARPLARVSPHARLASAVCFWFAFALISLATCTDSAFDSVTDARFSGDLVQGALVIIGVFATTVLMSSRTATLSIARLLVPLSLSLASALAFGLGATLDRAPWLVGLGLTVSMIVNHTLVARVAPLRSRRMWRAIDLLHWWMFGGLGLAAAAMVTTVIVSRPSYQPYYGMEQWGSNDNSPAWPTWLLTTASEFVWISLVAVVFAAPIYVMLIAVAGSRLRKQQSRDAAARAATPGE